MSQETGVFPVDRLTVVSLSVYDRRGEYADTEAWNS